VAAEKGAGAVVEDAPAPPAVEVQDAPEEVRPLRAEDIDTYSYHHRAGVSLEACSLCGSLLAPETVPTHKVWHEGTGQ
jgi:hypothetical protein